MPNGDRLESFVFLVQFGKVVCNGLVHALDVPFVDRDPYERGGEGFGHREGGVYRGFVVAIEVPLVEHLIVVDDEECRRPARIEVVFEAAVATVARDGLDLGGVWVISGELLEVSVVGLAPEDSPCQVKVWCQHVCDEDNDQREYKEQTRTGQQQLERSWNRHAFSLHP